MTTNLITDLEQQLLTIEAQIQTAAEATDRLDDTDASFDIGIELLDARNAIRAALEKLDRLSSPPTGPRFDSPLARWREQGEAEQARIATIVNNPALTAVYAEIDELF